MVNSSVIHIGFTGHRPTKLGGYNLNTAEYKNLQKDLELYIERCLEQYDTFVGHSGLALGGDTIWSKAILAMKDRYPNRVQFHAEIPCLQQADIWYKQSDIDFWHEQIKKADYQTIYGDMAHLSDAERKRVSARLLNDRNIGMISHSDAMLALHDGSSGGTGNAVRDCARLDVPVFAIHPKVYFG